MDFDRSLPPVARTALDVAVWFLDRARGDDCHLPFQKLQRLLYLAQSLFAAETGGMLMPAIFLAEEGGPVEPNMQRLLSGGRPDSIVVESPPGRAAEILESLWQKFGHMPPERLNALVSRNTAYVEAWDLGRGNGSVIDTGAMAAAARPAQSAPAEATEEPRILRSQSGASVAVRPWQPPAVGKPKI